MAKYYSKDELVRCLQDLSAKLGRTPVPEDMGTDPSAQHVLKFFKKWQRALKAAGLAEKKTIAVDIKAEAPKKTAEAKPVEKEQEAEAPCVRRYSKSIITKMLVDECTRLGKKPTRKDIDDNKDLPTVSTILKYFGTTRMGDVWKEVLGE